MFDKPFDKIEKDDIVRLVEKKVPEDRYLDYKEKWKGEKEKEDLLTDVTAFANTGGGYLIYGIIEGDDDETKGRALSCPGLAGFFSDEETCRIDNWLRDCVKPRISGVRHKVITGFKDGPILIIMVPQSFSAPHSFVSSKSGYQFYGRSERGNFPLDIQQVRDAFLASENLGERIRRFREDRVIKIYSGEIMPSQPSAGLIIHCIPARAFSYRQEVDISVCFDSSNYRLFQDGDTTLLIRCNFEGVLVEPQQRSQNEGNSIPFYYQIYRNGSLEFYTQITQNGANSLEAQYLSMNIKDKIEKLYSILRILKVEGAIFVFVTIFGIKGTNFCYDPYREDKLCEIAKIAQSTQEHIFDRDVLLLREIKIEDISKLPPSVVKPLLDHLWQAAGWQSCFLYDKNGNWIIK